MNLSWIDWSIMAVSVVVLRLVSLSTRRYMIGVSDFLSANRVAGRYLLTIALQMGCYGVISFILARYDYSVYLPDGVELSSCSHLKAVDFHVTSDWHRLVFVE